MTTALEAAEALKKEAAEKVAEAERLQRLTAAYPDLQRHVNRWKTVRYYSKAVNTVVDRFELRHSCGCCSDAELQLWPYLETPDGNVYSDPPCFGVGEQHWISGDRPYDGWRKRLRDAGLPEVIVEAVARRFKKDVDDRTAAAEEEAYEDEEVDEGSDR